MVSSPAPALTLSTSAPPVRVSLNAEPVKAKPSVWRPRVTNTPAAAVAALIASTLTRRAFVIVFRSAEVAVRRRVSVPPPPSMVSAPTTPTIVSAAPVPVKVSAKAEPVKVKPSVWLARLTVTPAAAVDASIASTLISLALVMAFGAAEVAVMRMVSVPAPPLIVSAPTTPRMVSSPAPALTLSTPAPPVRVSLNAEPVTAKPSVWRPRFTTTPAAAVAALIASTLVSAAFVMAFRAAEVALRRIVSVPAPPLIVSAPMTSTIVSSPPPPLITSAPERPSITLALASPVSVSL